MPSQSDLARTWGISRARVCQLVKMGMPVNTEEAARAWRDALGVKQVPVNKGKGAEKPRKRPLAPATRKATPSPARSSKSKLAKKQEAAAAPAKPEEKVKIVRVVIEPPTKSGDSLKDALDSAIFVADMAFEEYVLACKTNSPGRSLRLTDHGRALNTRLQAEKAYREEMQRRGTLVEKIFIMQVARTAIETITGLIKKLPSEQGPQCNPTDALLATKVLEKQVTIILKAGAKAISDLK